MGSSDTDLTLSRWVSPRHPLTAMTPPSGGLAGGGGPSSPLTCLPSCGCCSAKSSTSGGLSGGGDSSSPLNCPPSCGCCSAKSSTSGGLSGGGDSSSPLNYLPSVVSEPFLLAPPHRDAPAFRYGSLRNRHYPTPMTEGSGGLAGGGGTPRPLAYHPDNDPYLIYCRLYKHALVDDDSSEDEASRDSSEIQQSFSCDSSPIFFPWKMEGTQWEADVAEAERQIKEEGWDDTDDDGPKRL